MQEKRYLSYFFGNRRDAKNHCAHWARCSSVILCHLSFNKAGAMALAGYFGPLLATFSQSYHPRFKLNN